MAYQPIGSREYKVMLNMNNFGSQTQLENDAGTFWAAFCAQAPKILDSDQDLRWKKEDPRKVEFLDSDDGDASLYHHDFVLRRRRDAKGTKITLKKRSADRVLASNNRVDLDDANERAPEDSFVRRKFEEDIKVTDDGRPRSLFSHSLDLKGQDVSIKDLDSVKKVDSYFPGFKRGVDLDADTSLAKVGSIDVTEYVVELDGVPKFLKDEKGAGAAVVAWYPDDKPAPCVVEFSFKYEGTEQAFGRKLTETSADVMRILGKMNDWRPGPKDRLTKTRWVYTKAGLIPKKES